MDIKTAKNELLETAVDCAKHAKKTSTTATDALKFTQAALNAANARSTLIHSEKAEQGE